MLRLFYIPMGATVYFIDPFVEYIATKRGDLSSIVKGYQKYANQCSQVEGSKL